VAVVPETTPGSPAPQTAAQTARDPWFDNAKMALVTLVVVGHAWTLLPETAFSDTLYDALYFWHVPAFVFVTGYLSRTFQWDRVRLGKLVRTVVVPYVVFETLLALFRVYVGGETLEDLFTDPHWPMWYLSALFFWRLLTPVFRPMWGGFAVAVAISLVAGAYASDTLDLARVLGLLPFFVLGLKATPEHLDRLRTPSVKRWAAVVLAAIAVSAIWFDTWAQTEWLYYRARYDELVTSHLEAMGIRAAVMVIGLVGAMAFLALVPRAGGWFTRMGAWTLVVYLFHGFVIKGAEYSGYMQWAADWPVLSLLLTTALATGLALLLAWQPIASKLNRVVDPVGFAQREVGVAHDLRVATAHADDLAEAVQEATDDLAGRPLAESR
jgi:fucose 4-O-acetylase-like acetyltransferase